MIKIEETNFTSNKVINYYYGDIQDIGIGGGILISNSENVHIYLSNISDNSCYNKGGGLYLKNIQNFTIENC